MASFDPSYFHDLWQKYSPESNFGLWLVLLSAGVYTLPNFFGFPNSLIEQVLGAHFGCSPDLCKGFVFLIHAVSSVLIVIMTYGPAYRYKKRLSFLYFSKKPSITLLLNLSAVPSELRRNVTISIQEFIIGIRQSEIGSMVKVKYSEADSAVCLSDVQERVSKSRRLQSLVFFGNAKVKKGKIVIRLHACFDLSKFKIPQKNITREDRLRSNALQVIQPTQNSYEREIAISEIEEVSEILELYSLAILSYLSILESNREEPLIYLQRFLDRYELLSTDEIRNSFGTMRRVVAKLIELLCSEQLRRDFPDHLSEKSRRSCEMILSLNPRNIDALSARAIQCEADGDREGAISYTREISSIGYKFAELNFAYFNVCDNHFSEALTRLRKIKLLPSNLRAGQISNFYDDKYRSTGDPKFSVFDGLVSCWWGDVELGKKVLRNIRSKYKNSLDRDLLAAISAEIGD